MTFRLFLFFYFIATISFAQEATKVSNIVPTHRDEIRSVFGNINMGNLKAINSEEIDYNAVLVNDGVIFTSTRRQQESKHAATAGGGKLNAWKKKLSTLFYSRLTDGRLSNPEPLAGEVNDQYHESSATFSHSGNLMFFTRSSANKSRRGKRQLKIFMAKKAEDSWVDIIELPFNSSKGDYSVAHPAISADGQTMYFASNRPGGLGGMDIYVAYFKMWNGRVQIDFHNDQFDRKNMSIETFLLFLEAELN